MFSVIVFIPIFVLSSHLGICIPPIKLAEYIGFKTFFQGASPCIMKVDGLKRSLPMTAADYPMSETAGKPCVWPGSNGIS